MGGGSALIAVAAGAKIGSLKGFVVGGSVGAVGVIGYPSCRLAVVVGFSRRAADLD